MIINIFTIMLGETLEAGLLFSLLVYMSVHFDISKRWLLSGVISGLILAVLYGANLEIISNWFDYTGQELINVAICTFLGVALFIYANYLLKIKDKRNHLVLCVITMMIANVAIIHEAAEIYLYFLSLQSTEMSAAVVSSVLAFIVGSCFGVLIYYAVMYLQNMGVTVAFILIALVASGMFLQSSQLLIQADFLPQTQVLWNSEWLLPEKSNFGELLRAMIRYESSPSVVEALFYLTSLSAFTFSFIRVRNTN